jgi:single-strand DNA-binding protein
LSSLNKIILIGDLTADPDVRLTTAGDALAKFSLAVERPERAEGMPKMVDYIQVVAWRQLAELLKESRKGESFLVEGRIVSRSYDDQDGLRHYVTEVEAKELKKLGGSAGTSPVASATVSVSSPQMLTKAAVVDEKQFDFGDEGFVPSDVEFPSGFQAKAMAEELEDDVPF